MIATAPLARGIVYSDRDRTKVTKDLPDGSEIARRRVCGSGEMPRDVAVGVERVDEDISAQPGIRTCNVNGAEEDMV
jgi:hypothetical protein